MGAAFNDEPNYFLRGTILIASAAGFFFGLTWIQGAGIEAIDSSKIAATLFRIRLPYFAGALFAVMGLASWIRGLMSVAAHLNSCLLTATLGALVVITITCVILFFEYRPDLAAKQVAQRRALEQNTSQPQKELELRTFTASDGRTMRATLIEFDGKKVRILRADGIEFTNRIGLYSEADQIYIREQSEQVLQPSE